MKYLVLIALLSFSGLTQATECLPYEQVLQQSQRFPGDISIEDLPSLPAGWQWVMVYRPSRDPDLQTFSWMSWVDGETLTLCQ